MSIILIDFIRIATKKLFLQDFRDKAGAGRQEKQRVARLSFERPGCGMQPPLHCGVCECYFDKCSE